MTVSLENFSHEELKDMSMIEMASKILLQEKKAVNYRELFDKIAEIKGFNKKQKEVNISQFYTDMNVDGRFLALGSGMWGLKRWYPVEQAEEELTEVPKKKKVKKKKKAVVDDVAALDIVDEDIADVVNDFDELDEDLDDDDFDDEFEDELDEELDDDVDEDEELDEEKK
ncbi:DNA-directed RNA polymerase subunit delta [Oceanobacillus saliphilus]|uniref:DNA-directed RNA polymerase subunit delta n=1 Tax=Oceanobacillus saliphilus TaxID=2925834 RepID=UPI0027D2D1AF|nr:DNA-directed RNA polymerase subunit delta [Oceanobacillus saliphilus]